MHTDICEWACTDIPVGAPRVLPGSLAAGKALPGDVQALAKGEWADAMAAATAAAEHARLAQEASNAAERFARAGTSQQVGLPRHGLTSCFLIHAGRASSVLQGHRRSQMPIGCCSSKECGSILTICRGVQENGAAPHEEAAAKPNLSATQNSTPDDLDIAVSSCSAWSTQQAYSDIAHNMSV